MAEQLTINRAKTAVLIMDYQVRQVTALPEAVRAKLLPAATKVMEQSRAAKLPLIFVEVVRGERTAETELYDGFKPLRDETLLTKRRTGPWTTTDLDAILKKRGIDTLVLAGINTSRVVLVTLCFATDMDYKTIILSDACADAEPELHSFLMEKIFPRWATVTTADRFLAALGKA